MEYITARIKSLVVPACPLSSKAFASHLKSLRAASTVGLIDSRLPSSFPADTTAVFDPQTYPNGRVRFHFETTEASPTIGSLEDLEPWRQQLLVVGIAEPGNYNIDRNVLVKRYPRALCHVVIVFGAEEETEYPSHIYPVINRKFTGLESALSDIVGNVLGQMSIFWLSRRMGSFESPSAKLVDTSSSQPSKRGGHRQGHNALGHATQESGVLIGRTGSIHMGSSERARKKQQIRTSKYFGSLKLLTGRLDEALSELTSAAIALKESKDYLWYASALEEIGVCLVLQQMSDETISIPTVVQNAISGRSKTHTSESVKGSPHSTITLGSQSASSVSTSKSVSPTVSSAHHYGHFHTARRDSDATVTDAADLSKLIPALTDAILGIYREGTGDETVPHTIYYETILRIAGLLVSIDLLGGSWSPETLRKAAGGKADVSKHGINPSKWAQIDHWLHQVINPGLQELPVVSQTRILSAVATLYGQIGMRRKWAFVCTLIISALSSSQNSNPTVTAVSIESLDELVDCVLAAYEQWPRLCSSTLRHVVAMGEKTGNAALQVRAATSLIGMSTKLNVDRKQQLALYELIRSLGDSFPHPYWDKEPLVAIQFKNIQSQASPGNAITIKKPGSRKASNAIIYNPFDASTDRSQQAGEPTVEVGVTISIRTIFQNPFAVDAQIYELSLIDENYDKISEVVRDVQLLAETSGIRIDIAMTPQKPGPLTIAGCYMQVAGCTGSMYTLPKPLKLQVAPERPELLLKHLTLQKGWIMLLEGEKIKFSLSLWNSSRTTGAELVQFGFTDSTVEPLHKAAAKSETTRPELYEYEYFLYKRQAIEMVSTLKPLAPQSTEEYEFLLAGKRGVTSAAVLVDYSGGNPSSSNRRLRIPLQVTVCPSVELEKVDLLPFSQGRILAVLDLRNAWREPLSVEINSDDEKVQHTIESTQSKRFLVSIPWPTLSREILQKPIPSLIPGRSAQFVRDTKTPPDVTEAFWLREELLSRLGGVWSTCSPEIADRRKGSVELRGIQLSRKMVDILKPRPLRLEMNCPSTAVLTDPSTTLRVTLTNNTSSEKAGMLRFIPDAACEQHILYTGTLQRPVTVPANTSVDVKTVIVNLTKGEFEWSSVFDGFDGSQVFQSSRHQITVT